MVGKLLHIQGFPAVRQSPNNQYWILLYSCIYEQVKRLKFYTRGLDYDYTACCCVPKDNLVSWKTCYLEVVVLQWNLHWQSSRRGMFVGRPRDTVCGTACNMVYLLALNTSPPPSSPSSSLSSGPFCSASQVRLFDYFSLQGGAKKTGPPAILSLQIFRKLHDRVAQKTGPAYLIANILKTPWPNCMEIGGLLQCYMLNTVINFLFKIFITLWRHLAKTQLLSFIHTVQIDFSITQ